MSPKIRDTPPKQKRAFLVQRQGSSVGELIDKGFFIFAGLATLWLGVLLFVAGWGLDVQYWVYFIGFWVIVAYLALPRLHRILSQIYVPNYFIGRTRTSDGLLGDPVNLAFRGTEAQLHAAMQAAGWHLADETTVYTTWKIISSTLRRRSYRTAPCVSAAAFWAGARFCVPARGKRQSVATTPCEVLALPKGVVASGRSSG